MLVSYQSSCSKKRKASLRAVDGLARGLSSSDWSYVASDDGGVSGSWAVVTLDTDKLWDNPWRPGDLGLDKLKVNSLLKLLAMMINHKNLNVSPLQKKGRVHSQYRMLSCQKSNVLRIMCKLKQNFRNTIANLPLTFYISPLHKTTEYRKEFVLTTQQPLRSVCSVFITHTTIRCAEHILCWHTLNTYQVS